MRKIDGSTFKGQFLSPLCSVLAAMACFALAVGCAQAQSVTAKESTKSTPSGDPGFSIQTEMLTYRALESNSEAVACDVAGFLSGTSASFTNSAAGPVCDVKVGTVKAIVVVLPFDRGEFSDFLLWRADMANMNHLIARAHYLKCPEAKGQGRGGTADVVGSILSLTPAAPFAAPIRSALSALDSDESTSPVTGTIQDQAFMDGVARELRALNVSVLMPSAYTPGSLGPVDEAASPFVVRLDQLIDAQGCLAKLAAKPDASEDVKGVNQEITDYFATLTGSIPSESANKAAGKTAPANGNNSGQQAASASSSQSHFAAVLSADGLAQKLGVDAASGKLREDGTSRHILMLKALESGGAVSTNSNVLGTSIRFSGGAVGTFALFALQGDEECSGNVYDFAGALKAKGFDAKFRKEPYDPAQQTIILRGSCKPVPQTR
jgi:hypothetical protein